MNPRPCTVTVNTLRCAEKGKEPPYFHAILKQSIMLHLNQSHAAPEPTPCNLCLNQFPPNHTAIIFVKRNTTCFHHETTDLRLLNFIQIKEGEKNLTTKGPF